jgi:hypothetical protein
MQFSTSVDPDMATSFDTNRLSLILDPDDVLKATPV